MHQLMKSIVQWLKYVCAGSAEEIEDLKNAYHQTNGSLGELMTYVPHSTHEDESRFITIINDLINMKELDSTPLWRSSSKDEKAKLSRKKASEKEAKEAEALAKNLGVWDEFYGDGKPNENKKAKGKGKATEGEAAEDEDHSVLQALILKKKQKNMDGFFDSLAAKYSEATPKSSTQAKGKGKKRNHGDAEKEESPKKKSRKVVPPPPEIDDAEFAKLQEKLFGDRAKSSSDPVAAKKKKGVRKI
jgi:DnaJ family protein C protein 9